MSARLSILFLALGSTAYAGSADHKASGKNADIYAVAEDGVASFYVSWWDGSQSDYHMSSEWLQCKNCGPELLLEVVSEQLLENWEGFYTGEDISVGSENAPWLFGDPASGDEGDPMGDFAGSAMLDLLSTGTSGTSGSGDGETCFNGLNGQLVIDAALDTIAASQDVSVGESSVTSKEEDDGSTTYDATIRDEDDYQTGSFTLNVSKDGQTTSKKNYDEYGELTGTAEVAPNAAGGTDTKTTASSTDGDGNVTESESLVETNDKGETTHESGSTTTDYTNGWWLSVTWSDGSAEVSIGQKTKDGTSEEGKGLQTSPSGEGGSGVGFCIPDWQIAQMINWNMLGDAVTDPNPVEDEEDPDNAWSGEDISPIDPLEKEDLDLTVGMMMPNEGLWVTYPVPFLEKAGY
ncbi:MAG: hypothetical protein ACI8S6_004686 [Myxococcota bacterium]|jgi:hypothetical protein